MVLGGFCACRYREGGLEQPWIIDGRSPRSRLCFCVSGLVDYCGLAVCGFPQSLGFGSLQIEDSEIALLLQKCKNLRVKA